MAQILQPDFQLMVNDVRLAHLFEALDELHSAASEGQLQKLTALNDVELVGWLRDFVYTAQETIAEIEGRENTRPANLKLVK